MTIQRLRVLAKDKGIKAGFNVKKSELIELLNKVIDSNEGPVDIYRDEITNEMIVVSESEYFVDEQSDEINKIAIYVSKPVLVSSVGVFDPGYHIIDKNQVDKVLKSKRIRVATSSEMLTYYGVK